ncbi:MAG: tRNA preQ1(34) S-adenosylmethionine ribosyltransferase-isomerase QueA [Pseudomonadota bacterium]
MDLDAFDFTLPEHLIALRPAVPRSASRLLLAQGERTHDAQITDLPDLLAPGDCLVFNDTRVLAARLRGVRRRISRHGSGEAQIEAMLIRREAPARWRVLARPAKKLVPGDRIAFGDLAAEVIAREGAEALLDFERTGPDLDAAIAKIGEMPLPPYIARTRPADGRDRTDYQSVFATHEGAVAAPTASLHFDDALLSRLQARGLRSARLTLHVGAGTFLPLNAERAASGRLHAEWGRITPESAEAINAARAAGGRIVAVGTTALRLLESAADENGLLQPFEGETEIFIRTGHRFRATDALLTNFHLPRSTLFMLVSALMGTVRMQRLYAHAIAKGYRFYSYGDASLLIPESA